LGQEIAERDIEAFSIGRAASPRAVNRPMVPATVQ
jgi:hypothetical protein